MKSAELFRKLQKIASRRGLFYSKTSPRGGGSHFAVTLGDRATIVPDHKGKELKSGTLRGILKALDLKEKDLYE